MKLIYKLISVYLSVLFFSHSAYSQEESYYNPETMFSIRTPWLSSLNAATTSLFSKDAYLETFISYNNKYGDFKKTTEPLSFEDYNLNFFAFKRVNGFSYTGSFKFVESYSKEKRWTYLMDTDRDMPYIIGDSIKSSFRKELLDVNFSVSHALFSSKIDAGIMINYKTAIGVKDIDPRPINTLSKISFTPSLLYKYSDFTRFAISFMYCLRNETIEIKKLTAEQSNLFLFSGLGFVSTEIMLSAFNRSYSTYNRLLELCFQYDNKDEFMTFSKLSFSSENTNIEDGKDIIKSEYSFLNREASLRSLFSTRREELFHALIFDFCMSESLGIRNVLNKERSNSYYKWKRYSKKDEYFKSTLFTSVEYKCNYKSWQNNISINIYNSKEEYEFYPTVFFQDYSNLYLKYYINKSLRISNCTLNLSASIAYRKNLYNKSYLLNSDNFKSFNVQNLNDEVLDSSYSSNFSYNICEYVSEYFCAQLDMPIVAFMQKINSYITFEYSGTNTKDLGNTRLLSLSLGIKL